MFILKLAIQRLRSRPGNSLLSLLLFAIGASIITIIILAQKQMDQTIEKNLAGIDLVVGAKGSPLQLILSSVLHADYPTGNIPLADAERIGNHPLVEKWIPLALGDSYKGFRIVGAPLDYAELYGAELAQGNWYIDKMDAVIGAKVARVSGLNIGDEFYGVHGFQDVGHAHDEHIYTVTGILKPGIGVMDNLVLTNIEAVWAVHEGHDHSHDHEDHDHSHDHGDHDHSHDHGVHDHSHDHGDHDHSHDHGDHDHSHDHGDHDHSHANDNMPAEIAVIQQKIQQGDDISREEMEMFQDFMAGKETSAEDDREITSMLLIYRSPAANVQLPRMINEDTTMQAASPVIQINRLLNLLGFGFDALRFLAWLIIVISGLNIFVNLYSILRRNSNETALLRVLGATPDNVFNLLLIQGVILSVSGWILGFFLSRAAGFFIPDLPFLQDWLFMPLQTNEIYLLLFMTITGILAAMIPAVKAYLTDVHFTLTHNNNA